MVEVPCPTCGRRLVAAEGERDRESRCPGCGAVFVPAPGPPADVPVLDISLPARGRSRRPTPRRVVLVLALLVGLGLALIVTVGGLAALTDAAGLFLGVSLLLLFLRACSNAERPAPDDPAAADDPDE